MKSRLVVLLISLTLVMGLVISGCAAPAPAPAPEPTPEPTPTPTPAPAPTPEKEVFSWRLQTSLPPFFDPPFEQFIDDVYTMSGGRIEMTLFHGGEIVATDMLVEGVGRGTIEMASGSGGYWPGVIDVGNIEAGLPMSWNDISECLYFYYGLGFIDLLRESYAEHNVYYLTPLFGAQHELLTSVPVNSIDDMKPLKIRALAQVAKLLEKFDIATVSLSGEELYLALATGTIDGLIYGNADDYYALKFNEVASYYTILGKGFPGYVDNWFMNMDAWNALPDDLQRIVELAALNLTDNYHLDQDARNRVTLQKGIFTISSLPSSDVVRLAAAAEELWDEEADKSARAAKAIEMLRTMVASRYE